MAIVISKLKLKKEFDRLNILHWGHFTMILFSLILEIINKQSPIYTLIKMFLFFGMYKYYFKTIKELYYTFWTFSLISFVYMAWGVFYAHVYLEIDSLVFCYLLGLVFLGIEVYILSSPIYYPRVNWWEYDFRYRSDIRIKVDLPKDTNVEARLTDIRRGAACVTLFEDLKTGTMITIVEGIEEISPLKVEIMSKRQHSIGRPFTYGVKIHFTNETEKDAFLEFAQNWKDDRRNKIQKKFENI